MASMAGCQSPFGARVFWTCKGHVVCSVISGVAHVDNEDHQAAVPSVDGQPADVPMFFAAAPAMAHNLDVLLMSSQC